MATKNAAKTATKYSTLLEEMECVTISTKPFTGGVQNEEVVYVHANPLDEKSGIQQATSGRKTRTQFPDSIKILVHDPR